MTNPFQSPKVEGEPALKRQVSGVASFFYRMVAAVTLISAGVFLHVAMYEPGVRLTTFNRLTAFLIGGGVIVAALSFFAELIRRARASG